MKELRGKENRLVSDEEEHEEEDFEPKRNRKCIVFDDSDGLKSIGEALKSFNEAWFRLEAGKISLNTIALNYKRERTKQTDWRENRDVLNAPKS